MSQPQFYITQIVVADADRLTLSFADGFSAEVNLSKVIADHPALARLADPEIFAQAQRDEWNRGVIFAREEDLTLASDNLRALAIEQSGEFSHQQLIVWMSHHQLTIDAAAKVLGLSRRMLAYYRSGEKPIPRTVGLAMLGWDVIADHPIKHLFEYSVAA